MHIANETVKILFNIVQTIWIVIDCCTVRWQVCLCWSFCFGCLHYLNTVFEMFLFCFFQLSDSRCLNGQNVETKKPSDSRAEFVVAVPFLTIICISSSFCLSVHCSGILFIWLSLLPFSFSVCFSFLTLPTAPNFLAFLAHFPQTSLARLLLTLRLLDGWETFRA